MAVQDDDVDVFVEGWRYFDNDGLGHISARLLDDFLKKLIEMKCELMPPNFYRNSEGELFELE